MSAAAVEHPCDDEPETLLETAGAEVSPDVAEVVRAGRPKR
ncbi:hypothetical protein [Streptomyces sp. NPDC058542]